MSSFQSKFIRFLSDNNLVAGGQTVLLAVSGGVDSMVMLSLFDQTRSALGLEIAVAHVNHQLRGEESEGDEFFVRNQAEKRKLLFYSTKVATTEFAHDNRVTKQEAARILRYQYLEEARLLLHAESIATAHQANDNAETVLMNAVRGTGVRGLAGIPLKRGAIIRPLLFASRQEIQQFAQDNEVPFRYDSSNSSMAYTRNNLRHKIIPLLEKEFGKDVLGSLNDLSRVMSEFSSILDDVVVRKFHSLVHTGPELTIDIRSLLREKSFLQNEIILQLLRRIDVELRTEKVSSILNLCNLPTGSRLSLGNQWTIFRDRARLILVKGHPEYFGELSLQAGREYAFPGFSFAIGEPQPYRPLSAKDKFTELVDAEKLGGKLILRHWKEGDWFVPLGFGHKKKLSDFFIDQKVPLFEKNAIPVLECQGNIAWVCGQRLDERFKVTPQTRSVIQLRYQPENS